MLYLLSPAKSLDYESPVGALPHTTPRFVDASARLIEVLRGQSPQDIASLMDLSDKLAALNVARYEAWSPKFTAANSRQALLAFDGDVYDGLAARTLKPADLDWAQSHVAILSGLYGVLRPLDRMQPYRLEMGTALKVGRTSNLYQYWGGADRAVPERAADGRQDAGGGQPRFAGVFQGGRPQDLAGAGDRVRLRRLEGRPLQDHQLLRQKSARLDGPLCHHPPGGHAQEARGFQPRGLCLGRGCVRA